MYCNNKMKLIRKKILVEIRESLVITDIQQKNEVLVYLKVLGKTVTETSSITFL